MSIAKSPLNTDLKGSATVNEATQARLTMRDTGSGMADFRLERTFRPSSQGYPVLFTIVKKIAMDYPDISAYAGGLGTSSVTPWQATFMLSPSLNSSSCAFFKKRL